MTFRQLDDWFCEWLLYKPVRFVAPYLRTNYWLDGRILIVKHPFSKPISVAFEKLDEIGIETTNKGPFAEDVFWILKKGNLRLRIGQLHSMFKPLMDHFGSMDGFSWQPFIEAMICTENQFFLCWKSSRNSRWKSNAPEF